MLNLRFKYTVISNLFYVLRVIPKANKYIKHPEIYSEEDCFELAKEIMNRMRIKALTETDVYGKENLPTEGGYYIFSNHQGKYDALGILLSLDTPCMVLWLRKNADRFLARQVCKLLKGKTIEPEKILETSRTMRDISKEVISGKKCLIFPEGMYNGNKNSLNEFKEGCFTSAIKTGMPIIPTAIYDSYKSMNSNTFEKVRTQVHFLKPILFSEYEFLKPKELADLVKERIGNRIEMISAGLEEEKSLVIR